MLWCPQLAGVDGCTLWKRGDNVVDIIILAAQLQEKVVVVDEEDGDEDEDGCEADNSKKNKETFSSKVNLPGLDS